jgi:hypothetical protein
VRRALILAIALALALAACARPRPVAGPEPARVSVEVARGALAPAAPTPRIMILLDATTSMRARASGNVTRFDAARAQAGEVLTTLPSDYRVSVEAIGGNDHTECGAPELVIGPISGAEGASAASALQELSAEGEASLAEALRDLTLDLKAELAADGARVVVFTDLEDACGGDLCAAVSGLVNAGASLDLVVLGERPTPTCVTALNAKGTVPPAQTPAPIRFRVVPAVGSPVVGVSGSTPVSVPAGSARVEVALTPPLEVGPLTLSPGGLVRVRVLDFPDASPPVREWSLEVVGDGGDLAIAPASKQPASP